MNENINNQESSGNNYLYPFGSLREYTYRNSEHDVREWMVLDKERNVIGQVSDLIIDTREEKVKYLDIKLYDENDTDKGPENSIIKENVLKDPAHTDIYKEMENILPVTFDNLKMPGDEETVLNKKDSYPRQFKRHILVPADVVSIDKKNNSVIILDLNQSRLKEVPDYDSSKGISDEYEKAVRFLFDVNQ